MMLQRLEKLAIVFCVSASQIQIPSKKQLFLGQTPPQPDFSSVGSISEYISFKTHVGYFALSFRLIRYNGGLKSDSNAFEKAAFLGAPMPCFPSTKFSHARFILAVFGFCFTPVPAFHQPNSVMQGSFWLILGSVLSDTIQWCSQGWKCGHSLLASQILMPSKKLLFLGQMSPKPDFSLAKSMVLSSQIQMPSKKWLLLGHHHPCQSFHQPSPFLNFWHSRFILVILGCASTWCNENGAAKAGKVGHRVLFVSWQVKSRCLQKSDFSWVRHHPSQIFHQSGQFLSIYPSRLMLVILRYPSDWYDTMEVSSQIPMPSKKPLFLGRDTTHARLSIYQVHIQGSFWSVLGSDLHPCQLSINQVLSCKVHFGSFWVLFYVIRYNGALKAGNVGILSWQVKFWCLQKSYYSWGRCATRARLFIGQVNGALWVKFRCLQKSDFCWGNTTRVSLSINQVHFWISGIQDSFWSRLGSASKWYNERVLLKAGKICHRVLEYFLSWQVKCQMPSKKQLFLGQTPP